MTRTRDQLLTVAEAAVREWAARARAMEYVPPQLWVLQDAVPVKRSLEDIFDDGSLPKDSSGSDLVPILRDLGSPDAACLVHVAVLTDTRQIEPPGSGVVMTRREIIVVDAADLQGEEVRIAGLEHESKGVVVAEFETFARETVTWPLSELLREAQQPGPVHRKGALRHVDLPPRRIIRLEIQTRDHALLFDLLGASSIGPGTEVRITEGADLRLDEQRIVKGVDFPSIIHMTLELTRDVSAGIVSAWLYDKLMRRRAGNGDQEQEERGVRLVVDRKEINVDAGEITKVIEEHIEAEE